MVGYARPARNTNDVCAYASVAEPVDATDSKSVSRKGVPVRFGPGAPLTSGAWSCHADSATSVSFTAEANYCAPDQVIALTLRTVGQPLAATEGFAIVLADLKTLLESGTSAGITSAKAKLIALRC
jgi:hypothetical protein